MTSSSEEEKRRPIAYGMCTIRIHYSSPKAAERAARLYSKHRIPIHRRGAILEHDSLERLDITLADLMRRIPKEAAKEVLDVSMTWETEKIPPTEEEIAADQRLLQRLEKEMHDEKGGPLDDGL